MENNIINGAIRYSSQYQKLIKRFDELFAKGENLPLLVDGVSDGAIYSLLFSLTEDIKKRTKSPLLILTGEERRANKLNEYLKKSGIKSEFYPVRDFNFYDITASHDV